MFNSTFGFCLLHPTHYYFNCSFAYISLFPGHLQTLSTVSTVPIPSGDRFRWCYLHLIWNYVSCKYNCVYYAHYTYTVYITHHIVYDAHFTTFSTSMPSYYPTNCPPTVFSTYVVVNLPFAFLNSHTNFPLAFLNCYT